MSYEILVENEEKKTTSVDDMIEKILKSKLHPDRIKKLKELGINLAPEDYTVFADMTLGQIHSASTKNNTRAYEILLDVMKGQEIQNVLTNYELPARVIGKAFVDLHRSIMNQEFGEYLINGGRGSLKSSFMGFMPPVLIKNNPNTHFLIVRPYANTLRDSVFAQVSWAITELGDDHNWKKTTSPMQMVYKPTGQIIYFRGGDEPEKIKSIKTPFGYIGYIWFEEVDQFRGDEQIRNLEQSALRGGNVSIKFKTYNVPKSRVHWINKYSQVNKPNMMVHSSTYLDAPVEWLGQPFIDDAEILSQLNPNAYEHEYLGVMVGDGTHVFDNIFADSISDAMIDNYEYVYHGQDWGWFPDPNVLQGMSYDANNRVLYIFREECAVKQDSEMWASRIVDAKPYTIVADTNEQKSINDMRSFGYDMRGAQKGPNSVHEGIKWLQGLTKIVIDPIRCPNAYKEFTDYEYVKDKEGNPVTAYVDDKNHSIAAVRYAMEVVWKRRGL